MATLPPPTSTYHTSIQSYTPKEWEDKRSIITQLYREDAKPLHAVQAILAQQYGFRPNAAMLKKRIHKWNLDRNKKHADMLFALRLSLEREAQGKKTVFSIRGSLVTFEEVKHYFRRKGVRDLRSVAFETSNFSPTTRIDCRTPEPVTPVEEMGMQEPQSLAELSAHHVFTAGKVVAFPDPDQVDRTISDPTTFSQVEQLLYFGRSYYDSIFENPEWKENNNTFNIELLENFYHELFAGQLLLEESQFTEAFVHFGLAFDLVRSLLDQQVLLFLPYMFHFLLPDRRIQQQEVISQLLDFISTLVMNCYPQLRPIQQSLSLLGRMSLQDRGQATKSVFRSVLNQVRSHFGSNVNSVIDPNVLFVQERPDSVARQNADNYELTAIAVHGLARDADKLLHEDNHFAGLVASELHDMASQFDRLHSSWGQRTVWRHGDIKPANILRYEDPGKHRPHQSRLATSTSELMGSGPYTPPYLDLDYLNDRHELRIHAERSSEILTVSSLVRLDREVLSVLDNPLQQDQRTLAFTFQCSHTQPQQPQIRCTGAQPFRKRWLLVVSRTKRDKYWLN